LLANRQISKILEKDGVLLTKRLLRSKRIVVMLTNFVGIVSNAFLDFSTLRVKTCHPFFADGAVTLLNHVRA